ncbi:hypothetical protein D3C71_2212610 [compost metagenome]
MNDSFDFVENFIKKLRDSKTNAEFLASFDVAGNKESGSSSASASAGGTSNSGASARRPVRPKTASVTTTT